jgi:NAD(P)-dependent dehydrogenase (short-subunit alcohol dehydrogenase family)
MTRLLALEFAPSTTVNAVAFGTILTDMSSSGVTRVQSEIESEYPLGRYAETNDIAGIILFLCSAAGAYLTGAVIPVDGGASTTR